MEITARKRCRNLRRECWAQDVGTLGKAIIMDVKEARRINACTELTVGDEIEAWHNGRLFHRGTVSRTVASTDLFWIRDSRTGTQRLIDFEALAIMRVPASGMTAKAVAGPRERDSMHVPLFQAPEMAPRGGS